MSDFAQAIIDLEAGKKVTRLSWNGNNEVFVELVIPPPTQGEVSVTDLEGNTTTSIEEIAAVPRDYYLELDTSNIHLRAPGMFAGRARWAPTWEDMIATDWFIQP